MNLSDIEAEKTVLSYLLNLQDINSLQEQIININSDLFTDINNILLKEIIDRYYIEYKGILTKKSLDWILKDKAYDQEIQEKLKLLFEELQRQVSESEYKIAISTLEKLKGLRKIALIADELYNGITVGLDPHDLSAKAIEKLMLTSSPNGIKRISFKESAKDRLNLYEDMEKNPEKYTGLKYGIKKLDDITGGMFPSELICFYARTGVGKSRFIVNIAYNVASRGKRVLYVTIEMPAIQVLRILDSRHSGVRYSGIKRANLEENEKLKYSSSFKFLPKGDIIVVDFMSGINPVQLSNEIQIQKKLGKIDLLIVDYLNLMTLPTKEVKRDIKLGELARELKMIARKERIPIITPMQANRDVIQSDTPGTEHVSFSDAATHSYDSIFYIKKSNQESDSRGEMIIQVVKGRDFPLGTITVQYAFDISYIGDPIENQLPTPDEKNLNSEVKTLSSKV